MKRLSIFLFFIFPAVLLAASLTSSLTPKGDFYSLEVVLKDQKAISSSVKVPLPTLKGLRVQSGPAVSTSTRIVNGRTTRSRSWTWRLRAISKTPGPIPAFELKYKGKTLRTKPLQVRAAPVTRGRSLSLIARPSTLKPFVGEEVKIEFFLLFDGVKLVGLDSPVVDQIPGFMVDFDPVDQYVQKTLRHGGEDWNAIPLGSAYLLPTRTGSLAFPSQEALAQIDKPGRRQESFFGSSMFQQRESIPLLSAPLNFEVQSLPGGAPKSFHGAVGQFSVSASPDRKSLAVGEALTFTVNIRAKGRSVLVSAPDLDLSSGLVAYETQLSENEASTRISKYFKTMIVPASEGDEEIRMLRFAWFDPVSASYKERKLGPWPLKVLPSVLPVSTGEGIPQARGVMSYGEDIRHMRYLNAPLSRNGSKGGPWLFLSLLGMGLLLPVFGRLMGGFLRERQMNPRSRRAQALSTASRHLSRVNSMKGEDALLAMETLLRDFFGSLLNRPPAGLLLQELPQELAILGLDKELCAELAGLQRGMDAMRYGGAAMRSESFAPFLPLLKRIDAALEDLQLDGGGQA